MISFGCWKSTGQLAGAFSRVAWVTSSPISLLTSVSSLQCDWVSFQDYLKHLNGFLTAITGGFPGRRRLSFKGKTTPGPSQKNSKNAIRDCRFLIGLRRKYPLLMNFETYIIVRRVGIFGITLSSIISRFQLLLLLAGGLVNLLRIGFGIGDVVLLCSFGCSRRGLASCRGRGNWSPRFPAARVAVAKRSRCSCSFCKRVYTVVKWM